MEPRIVMSYIAAGICLLMGFIIGYMSRSPVPDPCPVDLIERAVCAFPGSGSHPITGFIRFATRMNGPSRGRVSLSGNLSGMEGEHALHIHEWGNVDDECRTTGGHYNPWNTKHGGPGRISTMEENFNFTTSSASDPSTTGHVGDLGNILFANHTAVFKFDSDRLSEAGLHSIIGRSIVLHQRRDDLGLGGHPSSVINGNSGERLACCIIAIDKS